MAPVVKVYGTPKSWNISRVLVSLEEAGVNYESVAVDFAAGEHTSPAHLARNVSMNLWLFYLQRNRTSIL
jgi:glutathione S-transferase